jgi:hypothetical protein
VASLCCSFEGVPREGEGRGEEGERKGGKRKAIL